MRGHVRKRGSKWAVGHDEGRDDNGQRIQRWRGGYATRKEAEEALTAALGACRPATTSARPRCLFKSFVEETRLPQSRRRSPRDHLVDQDRW
jgi:hypothetical protein